MAKKLHGISIDTLEDQRSFALKGGTVTEAEWVKKFISIMQGLLKNDPLRYRSFGPYWWIVKNAMINAGINEFGEAIDAEWLEQSSYDTDYHGLLAALLYSGQMMNNGLIYANQHNIELKDEDGVMDMQVYVLADEDMETLAIEKSFK